MTNFFKYLCLFAVALVALSACTPQGQNNVEESTEQAIKIHSPEEINEVNNRTNVDGSSEHTSSGGVTNQTDNTATLKFNDLGDLQTKEMIEDLARLGVFKDVIVDANFKPYDPIKRSEYVIWLFKAYNAIKPPAEHIRLAPPTMKAKFKDVPETHPSYKYIQALANAGYSVGYEDGSFKPDQALTREEMIAIKVGVDSGKASDKVSIADINAIWGFGDAKQIDPRYSGYVYKDGLKASGNSKHSRSNIMRAFGKVGVFKPKEPVLRHEAVATLWQVDELGQATATETHPPEPRPMHTPYKH